jgi:hypothetical protein
VEFTKNLQISGLRTRATKEMKTRVF